MRSHVLRVSGFRRNLRIDPRRAQAERCVDRIVVTMNQVVHDAGMPRMLRENLFEHGCGAHIGGKVSSFLGGAEDCERVEGSSIHIVGKFVV